MSTTGFTSSGGICCADALGASQASLFVWSFPRTRGDGPVLGNRGSLAAPSGFPPHARGWTLQFVQPTCCPGERVSPARAGMDPISRVASTRISFPGRFPRTRGDGPLNPTISKVSARNVLADGYPPAMRFPRTRGDGPMIGMNDTASPLDSFPRTRGDGPELTFGRNDIRGRFPRTRGDGPHSVTLNMPASQPVSPARAGMDRVARSAHAFRCSFPRTRGDGPPPPAEFPPHARGWTSSPAKSSGDQSRAGMDP